MDQYAICMGSCIYLDTKDDSVQSFDVPLCPKEGTSDGSVSWSLVVAASGVPKDTEGTLSHLKSSQQHALALLKQRDPSFDYTVPILDTAEVARLSKTVQAIEAAAAPFCSAALGNHAITVKAREELCRLALDEEETNPSNAAQSTKHGKLAALQRLGALINAHHAHLRDDLGITVRER